MVDPSSNPAVESRKPRVLVVENDSEVREANITKLTYWDYEPVVAVGRGRALLNDAREKASAFRCQLALVDMHLLDDYDHNDWSGLKLVPELLPTAAIIYSGSRSYQAVRGALNEFGALDFVGKSEEPEYLRAVLDRHAREHCSCRNPLVIKWPDDITSTRVAEIFTKDQPIPPDEPEDVLVGLFPRASTLELSFLGGANPTTVSTPRPRSMIMLASVDGRQPVIVKLARREKIAKELENYEKYITGSLVGSYRPNLQAGNILWDMGGAVFNFVGITEKIIPFSRYYPIAKPRPVKRILRQFFTSAWSPMYRRPAVRKGQTLFEAYCSIWYGTWWLERLVHLKNSGLLPSWQDLAPAAAASDLPDPVDWLLERAETGRAGALGDIPVAITHGDLHSENLLVDVSNHTAWVIDFERTGEGHVLQDFVELEADLVTHLVHLPENDHGPFCTLCLFLCTQVRLDKMPLLATGNPLVDQASDIVAFLRRTAAEMTGIVDARSYLWGLLFNAMFRALIVYNAGGSPYRVQLALLLSSVLAHRLDHWDEAWPPSDWPAALQSRSTVPSNGIEEETEDNHA